MSSPKRVDEAIDSLTSLSAGSMSARSQPRPSSEVHTAPVDLPVTGSRIEPKMRHGSPSSAGASRSLTLDTGSG
jgi:hypothetical protein